jgi:hypothetical protein
VRFFCVCTEALHANLYLHKFTSPSHKESITYAIIDDRYSMLRLFCSRSSTCNHINFVPGYNTHTGAHTHSLVSNSTRPGTSHSTQCLGAESKHAHKAGWRMLCGGPAAPSLMQVSRTVCAVLLCFPSASCSNSCRAAWLCHVERERERLV